METKLSIAFVKDWHDDLEHIGGNKDGILAAFDELARRHQVILYSHHNTYDSDIPKIQADVIISWGSLDRPWHNSLPKEIPKILCFAGGPTTHEYLSKFNHVCL